MSWASGKSDLGSSARSSHLGAMSWVSLVLASLWALGATASDEMDEVMEYARARRPGFVNSLCWECQYKCDTCVPNAWYAVDGASCGHRTKVRPSFYQLGYYCSNPFFTTEDQVIRDNRSCYESAFKMQYHHGFKNFAPSSVVNLSEHQTLVVNFTADRGCWVQDIEGEFNTPLCFGQIHLLALLVTQLGAVLVGFVLALLSGGGHPIAREDSRQAYAAGAKLMVVDLYVASHRQLIVKVYRFVQVVTNCWYPVLIATGFNPVAVFAAWILMYLLPTLCTSGFTIFANPELLLAPVSNSLLGLHHKQRSALCDYILSLIRIALLLPLTAVLVAFWAVAKGYDEDDDSYLDHIVNMETYFRQQVLPYWGSVLFAIGNNVCTICVVIYVIWTFGLLVNAICCSGRCGSACFMLDFDRETSTKIQKKTLQVCEAAAELPLRQARRRVMDVGVEPTGTLSLLIAGGTALVDFGSYIYSIVIFLMSARYILACLTAVSVWESIFLLFLKGHFRRMGTAWRMTKRAGIPTSDWRCLLNWDNGIAGVPALTCKIYGLALSDTTSFISFCISTFFMFSSTKAMAAFIFEKIDVDTNEIVELADAVFGSLDEVGLKTKEVLGDLDERTRGLMVVKLGDVGGRAKDIIHRGLLEDESTSSEEDDESALSARTSTREFRPV